MHNVHLKILKNIQEHIEYGGDKVAGWLLIFHFS